jgi:hypothetical protein
MNDENKNKDYNLFDNEDRMEDDLELDRESETEKPKEFLNFEDEEDDNSEEADKEEENENEDLKDENIIIPKSKAVLINSLLKKISENVENIKKMMPEVGDEFQNRIGIGQLEEKIKNNESKNSEIEDLDSKIIEGVFDGMNMIGPDGKQYSVPANYASKSKLVEGDILKLTITNNGTFLYKQIGPIDRSRVVAKLEKDEEGNCYAVTEDKKWKILPASVTYYKGEPGDEIILLIPKRGESRWGAVENIVSNIQE